MPGNYYAHLDQLKAALSIPATATDKHSLLDSVLDGVSREIDRHCECQFYPSSGVRYYQARNSLKLDLDYPLVGIDSITLDTDGDATYESTLDSTSYYTLPDNATANSPKQPHWCLEVRAGSGATAVFPVGVKRGVKITGTWGWYDERTEATNVPATTIDSTQKSITITGSTNIHPGQTLRLGSEQIFVEERSTGTLTVRRAMNGTTGATHSSLSTCSIYEYPIVDRACLYQAEMDYRAQDAPLGISGGDLSGGMALRSLGGLHPFVQRQLSGFREPVAR